MGCLVEKNAGRWSTWVNLNASVMASDLISILIDFTFGPSQVSGQFI